jgi:hypothetical protein
MMQIARASAGRKKWRENPNSSRQDAKAQRSAQEKSLLSFASFAYFAALRETGLSVRELLRQPG